VLVLVSSETYTSKQQHFIKRKAETDVKDSTREEALAKSRNVLTTAPKCCLEIYEPEPKVC
jgi:hypothetical protein